MRRNPESHLDDIAKRFAATAPRRPGSTDPNIPEGAPHDFDDETNAPASMRSRRATAIIVTVTLVLVGTGALIALLLMRA